MKKMSLGQEDGFSLVAVLVGVALLSCIVLVLSDGARQFVRGSRQLSAVSSYEDVTGALRDLTARQIKAYFSVPTNSECPGAQELFPAGLPNALSAKLVSNVTVTAMTSFSPTPDDNDEVGGVRQNCGTTKTASGATFCVNISPAQTSSNGFFATQDAFVRFTYDMRHAHTGAAIACSDVQNMKPVTFAKTSYTLYWKHKPRESEIVWKKKRGFFYVPMQ